MDVVEISRWCRAESDVRFQNDRHLSDVLRNLRFTRSGERSPGWFATSSVHQAPLAERHGLALTLVGLLETSPHVAAVRLDASHRIDIDIAAQSASAWLMTLIADRAAQSPAALTVETPLVMPGDARQWSMVEDTIRTSHRLWRNDSRYHLVDAEQLASTLERTPLAIDICSRLGMWTQVQQDYHRLHRPTLVHQYALDLARALHPQWRSTGFGVMGMTRWHRYDVALNAVLGHAVAIVLSKAIDVLRVSTLGLDVNNGHA